MLKKYQYTKQCKINIDYRRDWKAFKVLGLFSSYLKDFVFEHQDQNFEKVSANTKIKYIYILTGGVS